MKKKAIIVSGPSGSGKGTLCQHILSIFVALQLSISATTRKMRKGEIDKKDYFFMLIEEFFRLRDEENFFFEWEPVYSKKNGETSYYGTIREQVEAIWANGRTPLFDVDVEGAKRLKRRLGADCLMLFVRPVSLEVLEQRLRARGTESEEDIKMRMERAERELAEAIHFDHVIINDNLDDAKAEIQALVETFLSNEVVEEVSEK
jgi:guanylate kinase